MGTFGEVRGHPGPLGAYAGSNETMINVLALIVKSWRIFEIFFIFQEHLRVKYMIIPSSP